MSLAVDAERPARWSGIYVASAAISAALLYACFDAGPDAFQNLREGMGQSALAVLVAIQLGLGTAVSAELSRTEEGTDQLLIGGSALCLALASWLMLFGA